VLNVEFDKLPDLGNSCIKNANVSYLLGVFQLHIEMFWEP
jgi:hypothetical protein